MISYQEAIEKGIMIAGTGSKPDFIVSSQSYKLSDKITNLDNQFQQLFNDLLNLKKYSETNIKHLYYTYLIYPEIWDGATHPERKFYKRSEKKFYIDIRFPDYEAFCCADEPTALRIMAEQTLRGTEKFLSKVKGFDYERFYADLKAVLSVYTK